jgi:two-component sensor histidine kinase
MISAETQYLDFDESIWEKGLAPLSEGDRELLGRIRCALPIAADVSRSDIFLFIPDGEQFCVAVHARSHAMATLYEEKQAGRCLTHDERPWMWEAVTKGMYESRILKEIPEVRTEVQQQIWPVLGENGRPIAAVGVCTNAVELARHKRRSRSFQRALVQFFSMLARGEFKGCGTLPPFTDRSGIIFVDGLGRYRYLSGIAANVYRRMGYLDDLRLRTVDEVAAGDHDLVRRAWEEQTCIFSESVVRNRILQRSVIPLFGQPDHLTLWERLRWGQKSGDRYGALLLVNDITEERERDQELKVKSAMIKEVHHRLKNNLQLLISVMRMQARRAQTDEAKELLGEAMNRLLSMSVIHESLSYSEGDTLNLKDVVMQIVPQTQMSLVGPHRHIRIRVEKADDIVLPTNKVTTCALVFNELLLNAVKHGFQEQQSGEIRIYLYDRGDQVELIMDDTGQGLPEDFSPEQSASIGLDIIRTLVQDDLKGTITFTTRSEGGARARLLFPKDALGGKEQ